MSRSLVIWISKSEPHFKRLALFILSGLWGSGAGTEPCLAVWKEQASLPLPGTLSLNLFQSLKKVSWGCQPEPVCNLVLLESQKNKIPHLGLEGREWRRRWACYKVWNMSSVQAISVQPASSRAVPVFWEHHLDSAVVFGLHCWASGCGSGTWRSCFSLPREVRTMLLILAVWCKILWR